MPQEKENRSHLSEKGISDRNTDELTSVKRKLRHAREILKHIEEFEGNFVHKLKNQLTPIRTCGELSLLNLTDDDPFKERIEKILESTKSVVNLADGWSLKLHFWLELEAESLDEAEMERYMQGLLERGGNGAENQADFEKRKHPRYLLNLPFECCPIGSFTWGSGRILNISKGGLMAVHSDNLENGQYLLMNISCPLAHKSRPVKMIGQIVWGGGLEQDRRGYRSGIKLVDISSVGLDRLGNLIKSSLRPYDGVGFKGGY